MKHYLKMVGMSMALVSVPFVASANPVKVAVTAASCSDTGRFALFQGTYTTFDLKRKETNLSQAVFLLDTQTGVVKRYTNKIDENGRYIETWLPTDLPVIEKRRSAQEGK